MGPEPSRYNKGMLILVFWKAWGQASYTKCDEIFVPNRKRLIRLLDPSRPEDEEIVYTAKETATAAKSCKLELELAHCKSFSKTDDIC